MFSEKLIIIIDDDIGSSDANLGVLKNRDCCKTDFYHRRPELASGWDFFGIPNPDPEISGSGFFILA